METFEAQFNNQWLSESRSIKNFIVKLDAIKVYQINCLCDFSALLRFITRSKRRSVWNGGCFLPATDNRVGEAVDAAEGFIFPFRCWEALCSFWTYQPRLNNSSLREFLSFLGVSSSCWRLLFVANVYVFSFLHTLLLRQTLWYSSYEQLEVKRVVHRPCACCFFGDEQKPPLD